MDTHFERAEIDLDDRDRLLSQSTGKSVPPLEPTQSAPRVSARPGRRRRWLMNTACGAAVTVVGAGVIFLSPYNPYTWTDVTQLVTRAGDQGRALVVNNLPAPPPVVAPAAQLARAPEPLRTPTNQLQPPLQTGSGDDMADFVRYQTGTPARVAEPAAILPNGTAEAAREAGKPVTEAGAQKPVYRVAAAPATPNHHPDEARQETPVPKPAIATAPTGPSPTTDPVTTATQLHTAPMTAVEQVQVLDLVAKLGTVLADLRVQVNQLRQAQSDLGQRVDGTLTDFTRRISLSEARGALNAAEGIDRHPAPSPTPLMTAPILPIAARPVPPVPTQPVAEATPARYRVAAASPGLAMLSQLDASGGEQRQLPVSPGQDIPGYGKVVSIAQRGATWIVKTDRGTIQ